MALRWGPVQAAVAPAAGFLLSHLSLLFIPVGVGVMTHLALLSEYGLRLVAVIVLSTWVGLAVTALVMRALMRKGDDGDRRLAVGGGKAAGAARIGVERRHAGR